MKVSELIEALRAIDPDTQVLVAYDSMVCVSDASKGGVWLCADFLPDWRNKEVSETAVIICADTADIDYNYDDRKLTRLDAPLTSDASDAA